MTWKAVIQKDNPWDLGVRLHVFRRNADGRLDILLPGGDVQRLEEGVAPPDDAGLLIPADALEAVADVFHPYATGQARLEGESAVMREALALERARVEKVITKALER